MLESIDTNVIIFALIFAVAVIAILILLFVNGRSSNQGAFPDQAMEPNDAASRASRFQALAEEREAQIGDLNDELSKLRLKQDEQTENATASAARIAALEAELKAERESSSDKIKMLEQVRKDMETKFQAMADKAVKTQSEQLSSSSVQQLEKALIPLKERIRHFEDGLKTAHKDAIEERSSLKQHIQSVSEHSQTISQDAQKLVNALKSDPQRQGAWGEMILDNILESSGLREGEEYEKQAHRKSDEGDSLRPDVIVRLPGGRTLVIDSKASLNAYNDIVNAATDNERESARKRHDRSLRSHIDSLAQKNYQNAEASTVDYVIMFIPIDGALSEGINAFPQLMDYASEKNIAVATPTVLMMSLKTVSHVWSVERRNENAEEIAARAGKLYDKLHGFVESMDKIGTGLRNASEAYDTARSRLSEGSGNLLGQAQKLKKLGAKTTKQIKGKFDKEHDAPLKIVDNTNKTDDNTQAVRKNNASR